MRFRKIVPGSRRNHSGKYKKRESEKIGKVLTEFPGNPTKFYRTQSPLKIVGEGIDWNGHSPEILQNMREHLEE
ncbi:MAG: hypothetical protein HFG56_02585 [Lachnospiraceae bacterium]|nr:hypothetical protein [Lachnospiraceae bacterium]